jgi:hypothetical protein
MESFRDVLDRLTQNFVAELLETVRAAAIEQLAERQPKESRPKPTRILRTNHTEAAPQAAPVVVRKFEIPVGQPRRRRRASGTAPARPRKPIAPPQQPKVVKFEVVPHPEQKNRRIVLTRLDTPT